jgi:hypothetical protein
MGDSALDIGSDLLVETRHQRPIDVSVVVIDECPRRCIIRSHLWPSCGHASRAVVHDVASSQLDCAPGVGLEPTTYGLTV